MSVADRLREKSGIGSDFVSADASQYNNLNLNHNKICDDSIVNKKLCSTYGSQCVSNSDINGEPNHIGGWNNRRSSNTWKKSNVGQLNSLLSINDGHEDKRNKNLLPNSGSSRYISTLTLHIAAYEKLPESGNANFGSNISGKASSHSPFQGHVFEIPRQQEEKATKPEIMNFKASQKLLNPNETKERKRPFQSTEEDRNRQESSNVACAMGESSDEESLKRSKIVHVCFFATSRKSDLETKPRSEFSSVSTDCSGSLISFGELINNHESDDALFNAPNEAALVLARGAGEFSVDWDNEMQKKEKLWICEEHRHILGTEWNKKIHNKLHDKKLACSISIPPIHGKLVDGVSFLSYAQAQEVLKEYGILEHVGTSLCKKHRSEINDLMEKKNLANEIVNSTSSNETPMEIDDNALLPRKAKMNAVGSYREWSPSDCLEPHRSPVKPWYDKGTGRLPFGVSSSAKTAFKNFTKLANINITTTTRPWEELDVRSRNMYIAGYKKICGTTAAILVGDENKEKLQEAAIKKSAISKQQTLLNESQLQLLYEIKKHYYAAGSNQERRAYLSIAADVLPENIVRSVIPDLSRYEYTEAKKEAKRFKSKEQKKPRAYNEVVPKTAIESFIAFFTSEMITTGIPFGDITTKLPNGNIVQLPSVVREWGAGKIIAMYRSHMKETGEKVEMSDSTMRNILNACPAKKKVSLNAVDQFKADGMQAFEWLNDLVKRLRNLNVINKEQYDEYKSKLMEAEFFYKVDYYMLLQHNHLSPDFCLSYALSDPKNSEYRSATCSDKKDHLFDSKRSHIFAELITDLQHAIESIDESYVEQVEVDDMKIIIDECISAVELWRNHIVRTRFSNDVRADIVEQLQNGEAMITIDFAQKVLPKRFREKQSDYFGKTGLSMHVIHILFKQHGTLVQHTLVHFLGYAEQDNTTVCAVLGNAFEHLAKHGVVAVTVRSDNAGYYHTPALITLLPTVAEKAGITIKRYSFSEPQAGKSTADVEISRLKKILWLYLNGGNDLMTPEQMFNAINNAIKECRIESVTAIFVDILPQKAENLKITLPDFQFISDIVFENDEEKGMCLRMWKHYNIGPGKVIPLSSITIPKKIPQLKGIHYSQEMTLFWREKCSMYINPKSKTRNENVDRKDPGSTPPRTCC